MAGRNSWKSRTSDHAHQGYFWSNSSGDDQPRGYGSRLKAPAAAASADEALWRTSRRIGAAFRWLSLDLTLLAHLDTHDDLIVAIEHVLRLLGQRLLPNLGKSALDQETASRPEVVELVGILSLLRAQAAEVKLSPVSSNAITTQTDCGTSVCSRSVQVSDDYMIRYDQDDANKEWIPLEASSVRRGSLLRCIRTASSSNASSYNVNFTEGDILKVINIDVDGDAQVVVLSSASTCYLWTASKRHWLLSDSFNAFSVRVPIVATSDEARKLQEARKNVPDD